MDPEIAATIQKLSDRIEKLTRIRDMLIAEYGIDTSASNVTSAQISGPGHTLTRKKQVIAYLDQNGPTKSRDIVAGAGVPRGTVGWILRGSEFLRLSGGKWDLRAKHPDTVQTEIAHPVQHLIKLPPHKKRGLKDRVV